MERKKHSHSKPFQPRPSDLLFSKKHTQSQASSSCSSPGPAEASSAGNEVKPTAVCSSSLKHAASACGTPVRIRGVPVGSVVAVESTLAAVSVQCEIRDASTVIPRNALIEANQSGLIAEPLVDITPRDPVPDPTTLCPPTDQAGCEAQGAIVCQNGRIAGVTGVAMDDLVGVMTRMAKKMEAAGGVERVLDAAELASAALEDGRPLLATAAALAGEALPLLARLREGGLVGNLEQLTETAAAAAADVRALQGDVLTPDNVVALRSSVRVLARTLEHVEGVARDVGGLTGDARVRGSLKQLIEALSRIVAD